MFDYLIGQRFLGVRRARRRHIPDGMVQTADWGITMSLTTVTPPVLRRGRASGVGSGRGRADAPRLWLVRDGFVPSTSRTPGSPGSPGTQSPVRPVRPSGSVRSVRSVGVYRSDLSTRSSRPEAVVPRSGSAGPRADAVPPPGLRLTRRGRVVVRLGGAGLMFAAVLAGVLLLDRPARAGSTVTSIPVDYRVILPGETLWGVAGEIAPEVDRRITVAQIIELNALPTAGLAAGQRIAVPRRSQ